MRVIAGICLGAAAWAWCFALACHGDDKHYRDAVDKGKQHSRDRRRDMADDAFHEATREAEGKKESLAEANLLRAQNLRDWMREKPADTAHVLPKLEVSYDQVIRHGNDTQRQLAGNNLAVLQLQQGKNQAAVKTFEQLPPFTGREAPVYYANFGHALEKNGEPERALGQYLAALKADPRLARAAEGAASSLKAAQLPANRRVPSAMQVLDLCRPKAGQSASLLLGKLSYQFLDNFNELPDSDQLWTYVVTYLARLPVDAEQFQEKEWPALEKLLPVKRWEDKIQTLKMIYLGSGAPPQGKPFATSLQEAVQALPGWKEELNRPETRKAFARILKVAGDGFYRRSLRDRPDKTAGLLAVRRFSAAFALDTSYVEAALAAVKTLADPRLGLDKDGSYLNEYTLRLFEEKSALFFRAQTREDYIHLLGLHSVLATIYEGQNRWGPAWTAQTATFQWKHAVDAETAIIKQDPTYARSPDLQFRLAQAYVKVNDQKSAVTSYLDAGDAYLQVGNPRKARELVQLADALEMTQAQKNRFQELDRLVAAAERGKRIWKVQTHWPLYAVATGQRPYRLFALGAGRIYGWNLAKETPEPLLAGGSIAVQGATLRTAAESSSLYVADGGHLKVFDPLLNAASTLTSDSPAIRTFAVNADGSLLATVNTAHEIKLWDKNGKLLRALEGPDARADLVALSSRGDRLIVVSGSQATLWDVEKAAVRATINTKTVPLLSVAVAKEGAFFAAGLADGRIQIRSIPSGELQREWKAHPASTVEVVLSADGHWLVSRGQDHAVHLWSVKEGKEIARLGNPAVPRAVAFSPDDRFVFIGVPLLDDAAEVYVWDAQPWTSR